MRIIVTGANGFVGLHFMAILRATHPDAEVYACTYGTRNGSRNSDFAVDIRDEDAVSDLFGAMRPTHVLHLAGMAAPPDATENPQAAWETNVFGTLNVGRAILKCAPECVLIFAGSGEVYGASADTHSPLTEDTLLQPLNEYAATKAAADLALGALSARAGLRAVRCRPFNHVGPGQNDKFAISSFASQIAKIEAGLQVPVMKVGDLTAKRDFLDVRDVARAYMKLIEQSAEIPSGEVINLASGRAIAVSTLLDCLLGMTKAGIKIEQDPGRMRRGQVQSVCGDATKARRMLQWEPLHGLEETIREILEDWRQRVQAIPQ